MAQPNARFQVNPVLIRAPVVLRLVHANENVPRDCPVRSKVYDAGYAAHTVEYQSENMISETRRP